MESIGESHTTKFNFTNTQLITAHIQGLLSRVNKLLPKISWIPF